MYKQCDRCHFNVPVKNALCHVCGSHTFIQMRKEAANQSLQTIALAGAQFGHGVKDGVDQLCGQLRDMAGSYAREIFAAKEYAQGAAARVKNLVPASVPSHDDLLSFHKNIRRSTPRLAVQADAANQPAPLMRDTVVLKSLPAAAAPEQSPVYIEPIAQPAVELEVALQADVETLKHNLDELKDWFENYGKEGTILCTASDRQAA